MSAPLRVPAETPEWRNALDSATRALLDPRHHGQKFRVERDREDHRWWVHYSGQGRQGGWCTSGTFGRIRVTP